MKLATSPAAMIAALALALTLTLTACGGTGGTEQSGSSGGGNSSNRAPSISAPRQVETVVGREVAVRPTATDPEGQSLTFTITNKPAWATFDSRTGELRGVPTAADVGRYENVRITASDGARQSSVQFDITVGAVGSGRATLSWTAPSERTDGSPLTNLAGFRIYYGTSRWDLRYSLEVRDPGANAVVIEDLTQGTWYFAATAFDTAGTESARTNAVSKTIG